MDQLMKLGPLAGLSSLWKELSSTQRVVVVAFAILSITVVILIATMAAKPNMSVLFSGLESADAGAIVAKLSEEKVPYKLSADGSTIEVPSDKVYDLRLKMATQGLPQGGGIGFEIFDKNSFGMTEFGEKVAYQRAIQGELKRTICHLAPVADAKVLLALPEDKLYASEQQPVTASVVLTLRRGMPLSDEQAGAIVYLVSSAVEGLRPENVTVIDSQGTVLSQGQNSAQAGGLLTTNQSKLKKQYEIELAQNIQSMLAKIVGPDKAVVRVSADLSFDQKQTKSETYEPLSNNEQGARGVPISEERTTEEYTGRVIPPGGVPSTGAARNRVGAGEAGDSYSRNESITRYEVTKKIEEIVSAPGQIRRLSVAVLVDEKVPRSKVAAIQEAVAAAAGIDTKRGDQVTVQRFAFDTTAQKKIEQEMAAASKSETMIGIAKNVGAVVLLLAFLFFLRSIVKQIKVPVPAPAAGPAELPPTDIQNIASLLSAAQPDEGASADMGSPQPVGAMVGAMGEGQSSSGVPVDISQADPEDLARLVRTWMSESS